MIMRLFETKEKYKIQTKNRIEPKHTVYIVSCKYSVKGIE